MKLSRIHYENQLKKTNLAENVFGDILRYKTKSFPVPFNVQYLGKSLDGKVILSDGRKTKSVTFSSKYDYLFACDVLKVFDIITVFEIKRETPGSKELFIDKFAGINPCRLGKKWETQTLCCLKHCILEHCNWKNGYFENITVFIRKYILLCSIYISPNFLSFQCIVCRASVEYNPMDTLCEWQF